jgi:hypothetical protein
MDDCLAYTCIVILQSSAGRANQRKEKSVNLVPIIACQQFPIQVSLTKL